jgi:hypothetical protein
LLAGDLDSEDISEPSTNEVFFVIAEGNDNDLDLLIPWVHEKAIDCHNLKCMPAV